MRKKETIVSSKWTFHTGRVNHLSFSPSGKRLASAGADESIYVWEVEKTLKNTPIKVSFDLWVMTANSSQNAHPGGVAGVAWKEGETGLVSAGADGCVRTWTVDTI